jgi:hypothetical protein
MRVRTRQRWLTVRKRQRVRRALALFAATASLLSGAVAIPTIALAAPTAAPRTGLAAPTAAPPAPGDEGDNPILRDALESTGRAFVEAKTAEANSRKRQAQLVAELQQTEARIAEFAPQAAEIASRSYRTGRVGPMMLLLNSATPDDFLARAEGLDLLTQRDDAKLKALNDARAQAARAKAQIDAEVVEQQKQTALMASKKAEVDKAMKLVGARNTGGFVSLRSPVAEPAKRNSDGSWPRESCSVDDPTTSGCITPRMLHAMNEAKRAGFTRFVSCFRPSGPFEHPKGRACDFSPEKIKGFGGDATGEAKIYGNNLMAFLVRNADRLGVLYVIWYRQVWFPATGWKTYSAANGDPSSDHTNHVHLSVL